MTRGVSWYQDGTTGARVAVLYTGTQVHLHTGHGPPGEPPDDGYATQVLWARLVGEEYPDGSWWLLDTRPDHDPWVALLNRAGGLVPDQLALAYWRAAYTALATRLAREPQEDPWE